MLRPVKCKSVRWASPGFPVDLVGVGELHAAFLDESRTHGRWWGPVAGNPGRPSFSSHVRLGERGAPVLIRPPCLRPADFVCDPPPILFVIRLPRCEDRQFMRQAENRAAIS